MNELMYGTLEYLESYMTADCREQIKVLRLVDGTQVIGFVTDYGSTVAVDFPLILYRASLTQFTFAEMTLPTKYRYCTIKESAITMDPIIPGEDSKDAYLEQIRILYTLTDLNPGIVKGDESVIH